MSETALKIQGQAIAIPTDYGETLLTCHTEGRRFWSARGICFLFSPCIISTFLAALGMTSSRAFFRSLLAGLVLSCGLAWGQPLRKVIIDEDAAGPGGTDLQAILVLIQSRKVDPLGITVVTGDQWRDEEVAHALRLLELIHRTDVPVVPGALFPLVRTIQDTRFWEQRYGKIVYQGAWTPRSMHAPYLLPALPEGSPTTKPLNEDAAHFLIAIVHRYPHQVTIYEGGPMTNLALAIALDPGFAQLTHGLVFMGGSIDPKTNDPEFATDPQHEFNLWFDPEAAHIVLRAHWPSITCTPVDVSVQTHMTKLMLTRIARVNSPVAQYLARYARAGQSYLWDELAAAAWLDPSIITEEKDLYMDVDIDHGAGYGNTLVWTAQDRPGTNVQPVRVQFKVDVTKFDNFFVNLMTQPTPNAVPAVPAASTAR
jgi:purine nucleosidase